MCVYDGERGVIVETLAKPTSAIAPNTRGSGNTGYETPGISVVAMPHSALCITTAAEIAWTS
jgi:hypothetical protein